MARCPHGFERSVVACPQCPSSPAPTKSPFHRGKVEDITGHALAGVTVLSRAENDKHGTVYWLCSLACGHTKTVAGVHLRQQQKLGGKIRCSEGCSTKRTSENQNRNEGTK